MHFRLVDTFLECDASHAVALKNVTAAEEYLQDHFPGFPVLPGVFMVEAMVHAAREVLAMGGKPRYVLGGVRALRYGSFVRPGEALRVDVAIDREHTDGSVSFKGTGTVVRLAQRGSAASGAPDTAVSGRFTMRPIRGETASTGPG